MELQKRNRGGGQDRIVRKTKASYIVHMAFVNPQEGQIEQKKKRKRWERTTLTSLLPMRISYVSCHFSIRGARKRQRKLARILGNIKAGFKQLFQDQQNINDDPQT